MGITDPFLTPLPRQAATRIAKAFLALIRLARFDQSGRVCGLRTKPVVAKGVSKVAGFVAQEMWDNDRPSPFHFQAGTHSEAKRARWCRDLIKSFGRLDPPTAKQKGITAEFVIDMKDEAKNSSDTTKHTVDLIEGSYFFAMRGGEIAKTKTPLMTIRTRLKDVTFTDRDRLVVPHDHPDLRSKAVRVTIRFETQKNGEKNEKRSQKKT